MERIFLRCKSNDGSVYVVERDAELAFEINGFRFLCVNNCEITDALAGQRVSRRLAFEDIEDFYDRSEGKVKKHFDKYLAQIKNRERITHWRSCEDSLMY